MGGTVLSKTDLPNFRVEASHLMVNFAYSFASLLGILDLLIALFYLVSSIALPIARRRMLDVWGITLYGIQALIAPPILAVVGGILILQGWRLDPILQFAFLLLHFLVIYQGIRDIVIYRNFRQR